MTCRNVAPNAAFESMAATFARRRARFGFFVSSGAERALLHLHSSSVRSFHFPIFAPAKSKRAA
jgi:hypothetical protein